MTPRTTLVAALAAVSALALAGCSTSDGPDKAAESGEKTAAANAAPRLSVTGGFMPEPVTKDMGGGFLTITNKGGADKLTSVTTAIAKSAEIHETVDQKMKKAESFDIPANGELNLARGGSHIMFMDMKKLPKKGETVAIELHFEKSEPIKTELQVKEPTYNPKSH